MCFEVSQEPRLPSTSVLSATPRIRYPRPTPQHCATAGANCFCTFGVCTTVPTTPRCSTAIVRRRSPCWLLVTSSCAPHSYATNLSTAQHFTCGSLTLTYCHRNSENHSHKQLSTFARHCSPNNHHSLSVNIQLSGTFCSSLGKDQTVERVSLDTVRAPLPATATVSGEPHILP